MPKIYEYNNMYFVKEFDKYVRCDLYIKKGTIILIGTDEYMEELDNPKVYTYKELRDKLIIK